MYYIITYLDGYEAEEIFCEHSTVMGSYETIEEAEAAFAELENWWRQVFKEPMRGEIVK